MGISAAVLRDNLRHQMTLRGLSQNALARKANVSQSAIAYILRYESNADKQPSVDIVDRLARAFGMKAWQLLTPADEQPEPSPVDRELLAAAIAGAARVFRAHSALPSDEQLAAGAVFIYRRVTDGVTLKRAAALVDSQLAQYGTPLASSLRDVDTGVYDLGKPGKGAAHRSRK